MMVPFDNNSALNQAISRNKFQFCLTNPASSVENQIRYQTQPLATLINKRQGQGYAKFGSVIFTRADREDINELTDLKKKTFIGVDELGFGGWRVAWRELLRNKINPYVDFKELRFAGGVQQKVVYSVRDGSVDAGSIRTDMLERMSASGKINLADFKVIGNKKTEGFPFFHSTELYPEWLFSAVGKVDDKLKTQVVAALFSITAESLAARKGKYVGWISPLDYSSVDDLLQELNVGPYDVATLGSFEYVLTQYGIEMAIILIVIILLALLVLYMMRLYRNSAIAYEKLENEIHRREMLEQQLVHIQKMESIGQLTGGIAHDFNNMLAIMLGFTELSLSTDTVVKNSKLTKYLDQVLAAGDKAKTLVSQMLAFSRAEGDVEDGEVLSVANVIDEAFQLLRPLIPSSIDLIIEKNDRELYIEVSRVMINQVLVNLCLNAKDAITGDHGVITLSYESLKVDHVQCDSCFQEISGTFIIVQVKDTGSGIDLTKKQRLFEPFYSTKEVGKGTGMGLSMAHGIIHSHDGHILLRSESQQGTTMQLLLPQVMQNETPNVSHQLSSITKDVAENEGKHILVVDDEKSITDYLRELLQLNGFRVTTFNQSQTALAYFKEHHDVIDLVLTDQTMPKITGIDMASAMLQVAETMPVILCTGFSDHANENSALAINIGAYLQKPIQSDVLLNTINSQLNTKKTGAR